jgi:hypothetical protein
MDGNLLPKMGLAQIKTVIQTYGPESRYFSWWIWNITLGLELINLNTGKCA